MPQGLTTGRLFGYVDASFGESCVSGYVLFMSGGPVAWRSAKQRLSPASTAEAEVVSASDATKGALYLRHILRDLEQLFNGPTVFFEDNEAAIMHTQNGNSLSRMRHINLRQNFVRDYVEEGEVRLVFIGTRQNVADLLTKPLTYQIFATHRDVMVRPPDDLMRTFPGSVPTL
jgi:hypothetical protein